MSDVIDFADELLGTRPDDLDRRIGKVNIEMLRKLTKNIILRHQKLLSETSTKDDEIEKLKFYTEKLENPDSSKGFQET